MSKTFVILFAAPATAKAASEIGVMMVLMVAAVAVALAVVAIVVSFRRLQGTTLLAPALWALFALAVLVILQAVLLRRIPTYRPTREKLDLLAATSTFCPLVALLGAKRPQNRPWFWIVLSLLGVTALPTLQSLLIQPDDWIEVHPLWTWFYALLVFVGFVNYLPTRFWAPALLATAGQCALLGDFLPGGSSWLAPLRSTVAEKILPEVLINGRRDFRLWEITAGIVPLAAAVCWAYLIARKQRGIRHVRLGGWNRLWLDFRNAYGVIWAMRVIERLNILSHGTNPTFRLTWNGFIPTGSTAMKVNAPEPSAASHDFMLAHCLPEPLERDFRMLLLRFVSNAWIDRRLGANSSDQTVG
jgi:hypothetical protein